ncbi:MAG: protein-L-isoaspartate O-methyltransferase [Pseudomonadota bacterium]
MDFEAARRIMVDSQIRPNDVSDPTIVAAFLKVPREAFVPGDQKSVAYAEQEIMTSPGRALWLPRDFSKLLKSLEPKPSDFGLVIGAGAGYEAAILSELIETAIGLEEEDALVSDASDRLAELGIDSAVMVQGHLVDGLADQGPFDVILINGMVETVPDAWLDQLSEGGRLAVVVQSQDGLGSSRLYQRAGDTVSYRTVFEAAPPKFKSFNAPQGFVF